MPPEAPAAGEVAEPCQEIRRLAGLLNEQSRLATHLGLDVLFTVVVPSEAPNIAVVISKEVR